MRAQRRTPEEQLELVRLCRASGLTIAEWCRREGINPDTYSTWIERLQKRGMLEKAAQMNTIPESFSGKHGTCIHGSPIRM